VSERGQKKGAGLVFGLSREGYDGDPADHWSTIKTMDRSPAHYLAAEAQGTPDTDARKVGRAVHLAVLEPERYGGEVAVWSGKVRNGRAWEEFQAANAGKEILTQREAAHVSAIQRAVRGSLMARPYIAGGRAEVSMFWGYHELDPATWLPGWAPIRLKGRVDYVTDEVLVDLKTTRDASPAGFGREALRYGYHVQAALYADGYEAATGTRLPFVLVAVESAPPHVVQVYGVPDHYLEAGRDAYRAMIRRLAMCRAANQWPGYCEVPMELELPKWSGLDDDEEDISDLDLGFQEEGGDA